VLHTLLKAAQIKLIINIRYNFNMMIRAPINQPAWLWKDIWGLTHVVNPATTWVQKETNRKQSIEMITHVLRHIQVTSLDPEAFPYTHSNSNAPSYVTIDNNKDDQWVAVPIARNRYSILSSREKNRIASRNPYEVLESNEDDLDEDDESSEEKSAAYKQRKQEVKSMKKNTNSVNDMTMDELDQVIQTNEINCNKTKEPAPFQKTSKRETIMRDPNKYEDSKNSNRTNDNDNEILESSSEDSVNISGKLNILGARMKRFEDGRKKMFELENRKPFKRLPHPDLDSLSSDDESVWEGGYTLSDFENDSLSF